MPSLTMSCVSFVMATMAALAPAPSSLMAPEVPSPGAPLADWAQLTISAHAYYPGYFNVTVLGQSSARNASFGVSVYGEDTVFDDWLFYLFQGEVIRTDGAGNFAATKYLVHKSQLNEDWEGQDEIYAVVRVNGGATLRTNTVRRSF